MKTYFQNGTVEDIPYFREDNKKRSIQELDGASPDKYVYAGDNLKFDLDIVLVYLYDKFRDLYFPDTEKYYAEVIFTVSSQKGHAIPKRAAWPFL